MADQIERSVAAIIAALNKINTSIQKTEGYVDQNSYAFGMATATEVIGVGGAIAGIAVETELIGTIAASCTTVGAMADMVKSIAGSIDAAGVTEAELKTITELIGDLSSTAVLIGVFSDATILLEAVAVALSATDGSNLLVDTELIGTSVGVTTGAAAKLWT